MKGLQIGGALVIGLFLIAGSAYAHHSAAGIDQTKTVTVEGTVKEFKWANPHSWIELEVPNSKGAAEIWNFEMTSPAFLVKAGWKATTLKAGDKVKVVGRPFRNGDPGGLYVSITLPNGQVLNPPKAAPAAQAPVAP